MQMIAATPNSYSYSFVLRKANVNVLHILTQLSTILTSKRPFHLGRRPLFFSVSTTFVSMVSTLAAKSSPPNRIAIPDGCVLSRGGSAETWGAKTIVSRRVHTRTLSRCRMHRSVRRASSKFHRVHLRALHRRLRNIFRIATDKSFTWVISTERLVPARLALFSTPSQAKPRNARHACGNGGR